MPCEPFILKSPDGKELCCIKRFKLDSGFIDKLWQKPIRWGRYESLAFHNSKLGTNPMNSTGKTVTTPSNPHRRGWSLRL